MMPDRQQIYRTDQDLLAVTLRHLQCRLAAFGVVDAVFLACFCSFERQPLFRQRLAYVHGRDSRSYTC